MKTIKVVAAIIKKDNLIFATQRGYGEFKDKWEFPGGKIEENETKEEALTREIKEELNASISIDSFIKQIEYDYPSFHLVMDVYFCHLNNPHIEAILNRQEANLNHIFLLFLTILHFLPRLVQYEGCLDDKNRRNI